jgi:hypothetical protein
MKVLCGTGNTVKEIENNILLIIFSAFFALSPLRLP